MADADTKISDLKTEDKKPADGAPTPEENDAKLSPLDALIKDVEDKNTVHEGVVTLVGSLAQKFEDAAILSPEKAEELAKDVKARVEQIADAVKANAADMQSGDAPFRAPAPATEDDVKAMEARAHATPHSDAAAAAVEAGMDTKTANEMTQVGSNI